MHKPFPYAPCINTSQPSDFIQRTFPFPHSLFLCIFIFFICTQSNTTMKTMTLWFSVAVVLLLWSPPSSSAATINDEIAKNLIRNLNLFPPHDINILDTKPNVEENQNSNNKIIVEKPLRFPNFSGKDEDGVSIDDLAHRAGYYPIQHSHAAK